jgi:hypothetical protein
MKSRRGDTETGGHGDVYRKEILSPDGVLFSAWVFGVTSLVPVSPRLRVSVSVLHPSAFILAF